MLDDATIWSPFEAMLKSAKKFAALERADLRRYHVAGRVLQARVEIPLSLEVKELSHGLAGVVFERGRLDDRNLARLARPRGIARLNAIGLDVVFYFAHDAFPFQRLCFFGCL